MQTLIRTSAIVAFLSLTSCFSLAQTPSPEGPGVKDASSKVSARDLERRRVETVRGFVERARQIRDLETRVATMASLGSSLWRQRGQENFARAIFLRLIQELDKAASSADPQGSSAEGAIDRAAIVRLRRTLLTHLVRHDPKMAQQHIEEEFPSGANDIGSAMRSMDFAIALARDGNPEAARRFAESALLTGFSGGAVDSLVGALHRLRVEDAPTADAAFVFALGRMAGQTRLGADELLVFGNYLFLNDKNIDGGRIVFVATRIENVYFRAGISGERSGIRSGLARQYLDTALAVLRQALTLETGLAPRKRLAAAALLFGVKARKFAPDIAGSFEMMAQEVASSAVVDYDWVGGEGARKVVDLEDARTELEKIPGAQARDELCLEYIGLAYLQGDLDTAFKLSDTFSDLSVRSRVQDLIAFRRAAMILESCSLEECSASGLKSGDPELNALVELGIAELEINRGERPAAIQRLQELISFFVRSQAEARATCLLAIAGQLARIEPTSAMRPLAEAVRAFGSSTKSLAALARRDDLTRVTVGRKTVSFSVASRAIPVAAADQTIVNIYRLHPDETLSQILLIKNERVLGQSLVLLGQDVLKERSGRERE